MEGSQLAQKLADFNEEEVHKLIDKELAEGTDRLVLLESLREGMLLVSKRFEMGEYFLPELIMAGELFKEISAKLRPVPGQKQSNGKNNETKGIIVFGTVHGDIHDIGKDVTIAVLEGVGFEIHDLGVNVTPEQFVKKIQETGAQILGLSGLITSAYDGMKATIEAVTKAGLRNKVKIMIGGGIIDERVRVYTGADAFGNNPSDAINICRKFIGEK